MRGLPFIGMLVSVPCLTLLPPMLGGLMAPGHSPAPPAVPPAGSGYQFPRPRHGLSEFHYQLTLAGGESVSLQGRRLRLQNKKMGFLRFALLQEVRVDHGSVTVHLPASPADQERSGGSGPHPSLPGLDGVLAPFPGSHVMGLVCRPITVSIDQGTPNAGGQRSTLTAGSARVEADDATIHFTGRVTLSTGDTLLTTEGLELEANELTIKAHDYTVSTPHGVFHGQELRSDIFLATLTHQPGAPDNQPPMQKRKAK